MTSIATISTPATMTSRELVGEAPIDAKKVISDVAIVISQAFRDLISADEFTRQECCDRMDEADRLANSCAHLLAEKHPFEAKVIQNIRTAIALAGMPFYAGRVAAASGEHSRSLKTYIATNPDSGLLKIGRSRSPEHRMNSLQTGAAVKPQLLLVIEKDVERELHARFAALRVFGEWFRDDGRIAEFIAITRQQLRQSALPQEAAHG